jgi:hypothetical protein
MTQGICLVELSKKSGSEAISYVHTQLTDTFASCDMERREYLKTLHDVLKDLEEVRENEKYHDLMGDLLFTVYYTAIMRKEPFALSLATGLFGKLANYPNVIDVILQMLLVNNNDKGLVVMNNKFLAQMTYHHAPYPMFESLLKFGFQPIPEFWTELKKFNGLKINQDIGGIMRYVGKLFIEDRNNSSTVDKIVEVLISDVMKFYVELEYVHMSDVDVKIKEKIGYAMLKWHSKQMDDCVQWMNHLKK